MGIYAGHKNQSSLHAWKRVPAAQDTALQFGVPVGVIMPLGKGVEGCANKQTGHQAGMVGSPYAEQLPLKASGIEGTRQFNPLCFQGGRLAPCLLPASSSRASPKPVQC